MRPYVALLGGEGSDAHPGGVGLDDAVDLAHVAGGHSQTCTHAAHRAVG